MPDAFPLVLVGAGGFGREVAALVEQLNDCQRTWDLLGFVDDDAALHGETVMGYPVRGDVDWLCRQSGLNVALTIGDGAARRRVAERLQGADLDVATLVHPDVSWHASVDLARGAILCNGSAPTVDVEIGPHAVVDQGCTVGHDAVLESFVSLRPGAHVSGGVHLERGATVGSGAVVLQGVTVGRGATVGAGAVVTDDLPAESTAVGIPARPRD